MAEYSRLAKGSFTAPGATKFVNLPFIPDYVELWNYTNIKTAGTHKVCRAWWDNNLTDSGNNPTMIELYAGSSTATVFDTIQTNGISSFSGGISLQYGALQGHNQGAITDFSINAASPAQVTTVGNHGLQTGDVIVFQNLSQTSTTGMQQIAGIPFVVTRTGATTFTIKWNTNQSNYTAFNTATSTGNVGTYKKVLFPDLYLPEDNVITAITTGTTTTIATTMQHNFQVGQEVAFRIPTAWGTTQLNSLPNSTIPGQPIYGYVTSVTDFQTFVVNINSSSFTAFNTNQTFASFPGLTFPQVLPVGDINSGGFPFSSTTALYPSPTYSYASSNDSTCINGPAVRGAFFNNTRQGFLIGSGTAAVDTTSVLMATSDVIVWHAYQHDFANP